jgi:hypothetical protein
MRTKELDKLGLDKLGREVDEAFKRINKLEHDCAPRVKFQVWGKYGWCTAYAKVSMLHANISLMRGYGIKFRIVSDAANDLRVLEAEHAK